MSLNVVNAQVRVNSTQVQVKSQVLGLWLDSNPSPELES